MEIAGYLKTSLIEWPGKISSVIFVPGCNFRCPFCHNADLVKNRQLTLVDQEQIFGDLKKRKKWVDGIVVTGGEPTLQPDLLEFFEQCQRLGFETMIETNGSRPEMIAKLLNCRAVNFLAMDIKGPLDEYEKFVQIKIDNLKSKIQESIKLILNSGVGFEFRTTVVPGLHDKMLLLKMARQVKEIIQSGKSLADDRHWFLQNFQPKNCLDPEFKKKKPFSKQEMEGFIKEVKRIFPQVETRGV